MYLQESLVANISQVFYIVYEKTKQTKVCEMIADHYLKYPQVMNDARVKNTKKTKMH